MWLLLDTKPVADERMPHGIAGAEPVVAGQVRHDAEQCLAGCSAGCAVTCLGRRALMRAVRSSKTRGCGSLAITCPPAQPAVVKPNFSHLIRP